jgi:hypothetical protein
LPVECAFAVVLLSVYNNTYTYPQANGPASFIAVATAAAVVDGMKRSLALGGAVHCENNASAKKNRPIRRSVTTMKGT